MTIPQGQIAYVFARDGKSLKPTQTLGRVIPESDNFQNARGFILNGGQRGPQRGIIREGTYAFNLAEFIIITEDKFILSAVRFTGGRDDNIEDGRGIKRKEWIQADCNKGCG